MKNLKSIFGVALATLFLFLNSFGNINAQQITGNEITLVGGAPSGVTQANARIVGNPGFGTAYYWFVAVYTIGQARIYGPLQVTNVPNTLSVSNYVQLNWNLVATASSYTVLKTTTPLLPSGTNNIELVSGNTTGTTNDTGGALAAFTPNAVTGASGNIFINNTSYSEARFQFSIPLQVTKLCFSDGTCQTTAGGGAGTGTDSNPRKDILANRPATCSQGERYFTTDSVPPVWNICGVTNNWLTVSPAADPLTGTIEQYLNGEQISFRVTPNTYAAVANNLSEFTATASTARTNLGVLSQSTTDQGTFGSYPPYGNGGGIYSNNAPAALTPRFQLQRITTPETIRQINVWYGAGANNARVAIYNATCNLLGQSATQATGGTGVITFTFTPAVTATTNYYLALMNDTGGITQAAADSSIIGSALTNTGATTPQIFDGPVQASLVFPATCGARTSLTGLANYPVAMYRRP